MMDETQRFKSMLRAAPRKAAPESRRKIGRTVFQSDARSQPEVWRLEQSSEARAQPSLGETAWITVVGIRARPAKVTKPIGICAGGEPMSDISQAVGYVSDDPVSDVLKWILLAVAGLCFGLFSWATGSHTTGAAPARTLVRPGGATVMTASDIVAAKWDSRKPI